MADTQIEMVDVVNENDEVTGQADKREAHAKGLLHRTVISEVKNGKGEWLLVKQAGDRQDAGQYVSPVGGHVRAGEPVEDALRREAMEEVGLSDFMFSYIGKDIFNRTVLGRRENHLFILFELQSDAAPVLNAESDSCRWFTTQELKRELKDHPELFGDAFHFVVKRFFRDELLGVNAV